MKRHIEEALSSMSSKMNLPSFVINPAGIICLQMESTGNLYIDVQDDALYIYLLYAFDVIDFRLLTTALTFCQNNDTYQFPANSVFKEPNGLGFAIKLPSEEVTAITLTQAIDQLIDMISRLQQFTQPS